MFFNPKMPRRTINLGISIIYHLMRFLEADPCFSILSNGQCCEHYMRIRNTNACKPCPGGYTGDSCRIPCPSPSYGPGCQQQCHTCSVNSCHHVHGCSIHTTIIQGTFTKKMEVVEGVEKHLKSYILKENASKEKKNRKPKAFRHTGTPSAHALVLKHLWMKTLNMMRLRRKLIRKLLFGMVLLFSVIELFQIRDVSVSKQASNTATKDLKIRHVTDFFVEQIPNGRSNSRNISHKIKFPFKKYNISESYLIQRLERYSNACRGREFQFGKETKFSMKRHFRKSSSHHILYCSIEKAGSTFWRRMLQMLDSTNLKTPYDIAPLHVNEKSVPFVEEGLYHALASFKTNFVFVIARNPFTRLLSGYLDKIYTANPYYWNSIGRSIRPNPQRGRAACYSDITFQEIVDYVINAEGYFKKVRDPHFMAMHDMCKPCQIPYDFIGKMETFDKDFSFLMKTWNVSNFEGTDMKSMAVDDTFLDVATSLQDRKNSITPCISMHEAYLRSWKHMQIKGLISDHEIYPFDETKSQSIKPVDLIKVMKSAHLKSNQGELKIQKLKYFREIYRTVHLKSLNLLVQALRSDFEIFDYDPFPETIFNSTSPRLQHTDIFLVFNKTKSTGN